MPDPRADTAEAVEEERQVAYVAATRAQQRLLFCSSRIYAAELNQSPAGMSWAAYYTQQTSPKPPPMSTSTPSAQHEPSELVTEERPRMLLDAIRNLWRRMSGS